MRRRMKFSKRILAAAMSVVIALGIIPFTSVLAQAGTDFSTKKVEILLSSDISGSYSTDDYKEALLQKLLAKGYKEENIRFIESMDNIKTTSLSDSNWSLYDHLNYKDPNAVNPSQTYTQVTDEAAQWVRNWDRHIYSLNNGKELTFLGYGEPGYKDYAVYKSDSTDAKVINFDVSADKVDTHTLEGSGFLVNAGVDSSGILNGYLLFFQFTSPTNGNVYLLKISSNAKTLSDSAFSLMLPSPWFGGGLGTAVGNTSGIPFTIDPNTKKINVNMLVSPDNIQCTYTNYVKDNSGEVVLGSSSTEVCSYAVPSQEVTGENGFGPFVSYTSHSCNVLTMFTFSNLAMSVNTSSDNALKQTSWSDDKNVDKYYVNITDEGLGSGGSAQSKLTSIIDNSVYYIGAGTDTSQVETDVETVNSINGAASFVHTTPGTQDDSAISYIADIIGGKKASGPLEVETYTVEDTEIYSYTVVIEDPNPASPVSKKDYEVVYIAEDGSTKTYPVAGTPNEDGSKQVVIFTKGDIDASPWFVVREKLSTGVTVSSKLLTDSQFVSPVVDFNVIDGTKQVFSHIMTDTSINLSIDDNSYSNSQVALDSSNSSTKYTITKPDGTTVNGSSITLTKDNAQTGTYKFTAAITKTSDGIVTKVTKKVSVYNDSELPSITRIGTAIDGADVTTAKTVTAALADAGSGIDKYAIIATTEDTIPDADLLTLKSVSSKDSAYYEASYTIPISQDGDYNVYAYVIDKSGNSTYLLLDTYKVTFNAAKALAAINSADTETEMDTALTDYAVTLGIDLTDYKEIINKKPVYNLLIGKNFTSTVQAKAAFDAAVAAQKAVEADYETLLDEIKTETDSLTEQNITSSYKESLGNLKDDIEKFIQDNDSALTQEQKDALEVRVNALLNKINEIDSKLEDIKGEVKKINSDYTTTKTLEELNTLASAIETLKENQGNLTEEEKEYLEEAAQKVSGAIDVKNALAAVNTAAAETDMDKALADYASVLGIDLTDYAVLVNKEQVYTALIGKGFTSPAEVKAAFEAATAVQKAVEDELSTLNTQIASVFKVLTQQNVTSADKEDLKALKDKIEDFIKDNDIPLNESQKNSLKDALKTLETLLEKMKEVEDSLDSIKTIVQKINSNYTTTKTLEELNILASDIETLKENQGNLTGTEKTYLEEILKKVNNAILVKTKKAEPQNSQKDPLVIVLENDILRLPDPDHAPDKEILAAGKDITQAKSDFDSLGTKRTQVSKAATTKLDKLLARLANIKVEVDSSKAGTKVTASGLGLLITQEDILSGKNIQILLTIEDKTVDNPNKKLVEAVSGNLIIGAYFDINLFKQIGEDDAFKLTQVDNKILITIEIPEHLRGKSGYSIIRVHDGAAEVLKTTVEGNYLTFETDRFSTYVIAYDSGITSVPLTGDNSPVMAVMFFLAVTTSFFIGLFTVKKGKKLKSNI